jgi:hypothetical protein
MIYKYIYTHAYTCVRMCVCVCIHATFIYMETIKQVHKTNCAVNESN